MCRTIYLPEKKVSSQVFAHFCGSGDGIQGLRHAKQVFPHLPILLVTRSHYMTWLMSNLSVAHAGLRLEVLVPQPPEELQ